MSLITVSSFTIPADNVADGALTLRLWYNSGFLDSSGQFVASGTSSSGTYFTFSATALSGTITVSALSIYSTLDAQAPYPQSIQINSQMYRGNTALPIFPFNQIGTPSSWIVPDDLGATISFETWTIANQRIVLTNPPQTFYTAAEVDALIDSVAYAPASTTQLGIVRVSNTPTDPLIPIAVETTDRRVGDFYNIKTYGAATSNTAAQNATAIAAAVAAANSAGGGIYIPVGTFSTNSVTISVPVAFAPGGSILAPATGQTITITKAMTADTSQHFGNALAGQGTISFTGNVAMGFRNPEWWGAIGDGATDDTAAIQAALTSMTTGGELIFANSNYRFSALTTPATDGITLQGAGKLATTLTCTSTTGTAIKSGNQAVVRFGFFVKDLWLTSVAGATTSIGIDMSGFAHSGLERAYILNFNTQVLFDASVNGSTLYNHVNDSLIAAGAALSGFDGIVIQGSANATTLVGNDFSRLDRQVVIQNVAGGIPNQIDFFNNTFEASDTVGLDIVQGSSIFISGGRFEEHSIGIRLANTSLVRGITIDSPLFTNNTTNISDPGAIGVTRRAGNDNEQISYAQGLNTSSGPNTVANALFESWQSSTDLRGWASVSVSNFNTTGQVAREGTIIHSGTYAAKFGDGTSTSRGISPTASTPIDPTRPYTLTFWWATPSTTVAGVRWGMRLFDSAGVVITTGTVNGISFVGDVGNGSANLAYDATYNAHVIGSDVFPAAADTMQRQGHLLRFPTGVASVRFFILTAPGSSGAAIYGYIDDLYFSEGTALPRPVAQPIYDSGDQILNGGLAVGGVVIKSQQTPSTPTTATTLTVANLLIGILTATPTATGATVAYTLPTGTDMSGGGSFANNDSFDWSITNLAAAALDTITITANTDHTIVGNPIVQSANAATGGIYGNSAVFRSRKISATVWVTYRFS